MESALSSPSSRDIGIDPLSEVLSLLKPRSYVSAGFSAGRTWSVKFPPNIGIKCYAVESGTCWLAVEGVPEAVRLEAGDCFVLPSGRSFRLASDLSLTPTDSRVVFTPTREHGVVTLNGGGDFFLVGSRFALTGNHAGVLLGMLPPIVHICKEVEQAALRWSVERMMQELNEPQPGSLLIARHLAHMMLIQALRLHMARGANGGGGWLFALGDKQIGTAIKLLHADPAYHWTVQKLAGQVNMSRSAFAQKFKETVGSAPIDYLTQWRMLLAGDRLMSSSDSISVIALSLGYESESAFSTAFKRVIGYSPRQYSRDGEIGSPSHNERHSAIGVAQLS